jgi:hypothetical protein
MEFVSICYPSAIRSATSFEFGPKAQTFGGTNYRSVAHGNDETIECYRFSDPESAKQFAQHVKEWLSANQNSAAKGKPFLIGMDDIVSGSVGQSSVGQ